MRDYGLQELLSSLGSKGELGRNAICTVGIEASAPCTHPHPEKTLFGTKLLHAYKDGTKGPSLLGATQELFCFENTHQKSLLKVIYRTP